MISALSAHTTKAVNDGHPIPYYFIDLFGLNQHKTAMHLWQCRKGLTDCTACVKRQKQAPDLLSMQMEDYSKVCGHARHTLMMLDQAWDDTRVYTRVWPLFQAHATLRSGGRVEIIMGEKQTQEMHRQFLVGFHGLVLSIESADSKLAVSEFDEDKERVLGAIEHQGGYIITCSMRDCDRR